MKKKYVVEATDKNPAYDQHVTNPTALGVIAVVVLALFVGASVYFALV